VLKPHSIQAILLDMDGTLVDAFAPIVRAMKQTLQEFSLAQISDADIRRHTGKGDCSMTALFGNQKEAAGKRFLEIHDEDYFTGIFPLAGASELLHWLQNKQMPAAIVTSKGQHRAEEQLAHLGWSDQIHTVIGKLTGRASKPDPESLLIACAALQIKPEHTLMIGDGIADMKAAQRAGSIAIGITASFSSAELREAGATQTFPTLIEAHAWLKTQIH